MTIQFSGLGYSTFLSKLFFYLLILVSLNGHFLPISETCKGVNLTSESVQELNLKPGEKIETTERRIVCVSPVQPPRGLAATVFPNVPQNLGNA